ncbi:MAG: ATP-binding cassette domain-containing protein [Erysipelotrichales bacterium]|nr:ATP-binding cassette domain-containing protein [Erysipelotrichales bacterium]
MLKVKNLTKKFQSRVILNDLSFSFPNTGLIAIVGESGCGKSTLLNIIANLDKEYNGDILFNNYNYRDYQKEISKGIGIIYQNYNLLDNYTAFENIKISALINDNFIENDIYTLANEFGIDNKLLKKKCAVLSGGEKQRIAILRVLINKPSIILADEPTGALDSKNSEIVMKILKDISKTSLVIVVTHNLVLANKYCDNVIAFSSLNNIDLSRDKEEKKKLKKITNDKSFFQLIKCHILENKIRHFLAILALVFTFIFTNLCLTFVLESRSIGKTVSSNFYDRSVFAVSKSEKEKIEDSLFSYVQLTRPNTSEMMSLKRILPDFDFYYDLSAFYPNVISITANDKVINNVLFLPCFEDLKNNEIVINSTLEKLIDSNLLTTKLETHFLYQNETFQFRNELSLRVVNIIEEVSVLNNPKIYYNYFLAYNNLNSMYLSDAVPKTYIQIIKEVDNNDLLSNYQMLININDKTKIPDMYKIMNKGITNYEISSNAYSIENTINEIVKAFLLVLAMFEIITLISCFSIILYITLSIIIDYQKEKAILISLGKNKNSFFSIFFTEMILLLTFSTIVSSIVLMVLRHYLKSTITAFSIPLNLNMFIPFCLSTIFYVLIIFMITLIANEKLKKENLINLLRNE